MKLAWISHRDVTEGKGGAEGADRDMLDRRPFDTEVTLIGPGGITADYLAQFDQIVCTGIWGFSPRELNDLGRTKFTYWPHDIQNEGHWLEDMATHLVLANELHKQYLLKKNPALRGKEIHLNPGALSGVEELFPDPDKGDWALWAHRLESHKGLDLAQQWASDKNVTLLVVVNESREKVFAEMRRAKYFVLLSHIFDVGPRSIIEAKLCGCELIVNDNVGYWSKVSSDGMRDLVQAAPEEFWKVVQS